jgi:hypothetical protein
MEKKILMIGVSTGQNTTNVLPALQMKIDYFVALETSAANKRKWSEGMYRVLQERGIQTIEPIVLTPEEDSRIDIISDKLHKILTGDFEVLWNLGGGQKAQQFALWKTFIERVQSGEDEIACYANPESKLLEIWGYDNETNRLDYSEVPIEVKISAKEIFAIYGFDIDLNEGELFYKDGKLLKDNSGISELMNHKEFREFMFKLPKTNLNADENSLNLTRSELSKKQRSNSKYFDNKIKEFIVNKLSSSSEINISRVIQIIPSLRKHINNLNLNLYLKNGETEKITIKNNGLIGLLKKITTRNIAELDISQDFLIKNFSFQKTSFLFEKILEDKVIELIKETPDNEIYEAYSNIKVVKQGKTVGEHDILLVTKWGTIISLDAKTFDVESKDLDARLLNLRNGAGRYVEFIPIFPLYESDIYEEYIPEQILKLPEKIRSKGFRYFTFNNKKNNKKIIWKETEIELSPISTLLTKLDLVKHNN